MNILLEKGLTLDPNKRDRNLDYHLGISSLYQDKKENINTFDILPDNPYNIDISNISDYAKIT